MHFDLSHPAGRLGVFLAFVDTENPDAILGRLDAAALNQRQHVGSASGVAVWVAASGELGNRARFRQALKEQRLADAVALYQGPFLDGIYLDEAPEFERWAETERTALAHDYIAALERLAQDTSAAGDPRAAVSYWRLLANADPLNAKSALGLMRALASAGDRYRQVLKNWSDAEPIYRARVERARIRVAQLGGN